jgi:branched-chain amino acid transport system ATP-binding protein
MLEVDGIATYYGASQALWDVSLAVEEDEVVGLLGRNGAGKTTTLRSIAGVRQPQSGQIVFEGVDITDEDATSTARRGITLVPEDRRPFKSLTVAENLRLSHNNLHGNEWTLDRVYQEFPQLDERRAQMSHLLSGGEQQMLVIAMALLANPKLILLDEPMEGLAPKIVDQIADIIERVSQSGIPILLVEQSLDVCLELADRAYLIHKGDVKHSGDADTFVEDSPEVKSLLSV